MAIRHPLWTVGAFCISLGIMHCNSVIHATSSGTPIFSEEGEEEEEEEEEAESATERSSIQSESTAAAGKKISRRLQQEDNSNQTNQRYQSALETENGRIFSVVRYMDSSSQTDASYDFINKARQISRSRTCGDTESITSSLDSLERHTSRLAMLFSEMRDIISTADDEEGINSLYWKGFGVKEHLMWALQHVESLRDGDGVIPSEEKHGKWSGIKIVRGVDPRGDAKQQYTDRFTLMTLEMRNVIRMGQEDDIRGQYWKGYGAKEHVTWILKNIEQVNDEGGISEEILHAEERTGIWIVRGFDPRETPSRQFWRRFNAMELEMRDVIREAHKEPIISTYWKGFGPKEHVIWTLHNMDKMMDDGKVPAAGSGPREVIKIVESVCRPPPPAYTP